MHSTLALRNKKEKKGEVTNPTIAQTNKHIIARDTWMPSLENWGGGLKIFCGYMYMYVHYIYMYTFTFTIVKVNDSSHVCVG